jgi:hypothetical protein
MLLPPARRSHGLRAIGAGIVVVALLASCQRGLPERESDRTSSGPQATLTSSGLPTFTAPTAPTPDSAPSASPTLSIPTEPITATLDNTAAGGTATGTPVATGTPMPSYIGLSVSGGQLGEVFSLVDLRSGVNAEGTVRLVWELSARNGMPSYEIVEESNTLSQPESEIPGKARLTVTLHDVSAMDLGPTLPLAVAGTTAVTGVFMIPTFDDALLSFGAGLARYEVTELEDPARLVVDVFPPNAP